ncbi:uncharacterized protein PV09_02797 [Verruconis gallopava]|uniref:Uncharacterized protein n=1 Tax=Verruconis gallopava TaxID=253628 RepID=A0A0D2B533_9PEZI|nr:uncharacterized protein PV09_02797 [Verruconis gallopava]KIW06334.1 hypothetical protein PV09_02797 [Verruconis gallopava]
MSHLRLKLGRILSPRAHPHARPQVWVHSVRPSSTASSAMSEPSNQQTSQEPTQAGTDTPVLALPAVEDAQATKLDASSGYGTARFDALGPVVVNVDGTLSRITNWDKMADIERKNTLRILAKRNKERLDSLKAQQKDGAS